MKDKRNYLGSAFDKGLAAYAAWRLAKIYDQSAQAAKHSRPSILRPDSNPADDYNEIFPDDAYDEWHGIDDDSWRNPYDEEGLFNSDHSSDSNDTGSIW